MKKVFKIMSVALVLILALSTMVMPSYAADVVIDARVVAEDLGECADTSTNYYKFTVYLDSTHSLCGLNLAVSWDSAIWQPLRYSNLTANDTATRWPDANDENNVLYNKCQEYLDYGLDGDTGVGFEHDDTTDGEAYMPYDANKPSVSALSQANMGSDLYNAGYVGMYYVWQSDFTQNIMNLSGGTINGANSPISGEICVLSWYMALKDGVAAGTYEVGFQASQPKTVTGSYTSTDAIGSMDEYDPITIAGNATINCTNAMVTVAEKASPVYAKGSQIRFNGTEADGTGSANFDIRTRAAMTTDDFNSILTSEDNAKALADAGKLEVGFVYTAGAFDLATAQAVATGTAADGYVKKTVSYIQSTGSEYVWTCLITGAAYDGVVTALGYIIVDGTPYYFDAGSETTFKTLYDNWYDDYTASLS